MPSCLVCAANQARALARPIVCTECGAELKAAGAAIVAASLAPIPVLIGLILAQPWLGPAGMIAAGVVGGIFIPGLAFRLFYRLEKV